jgi:hypothetical protein
MKSFDYDAPWPTPFRRRLYVLQWMAHLELQNRRSSRSVLDPAGPVVSLTSFGRRIKTVHLTLESIAAGTLRPSRLLLWLDDDRALTNPPASLRRLARRGLELCSCENLGPHKKYFPYLQAQDLFTGPLVTADDDVLYPSFWLEGLVRAERENPRSVHCYRAHVAELQAGESIGFAPYERWAACASRTPSHLHFSTGCSGVLFPAPVLRALKASGKEFLGCCPWADDVWLNLHALRTGFEVAQVTEVPYRFFGILLTQTSGLFKKNLFGGGNDAALAATFTPEDMRRLLSFSYGTPRSHCA